MSSAASSQNSCIGVTENPRKVQNYDILKHLFNKSVPTGALGHSNNQLAQDSDEEEAMSMSQEEGLEAGASSGSRGKRKAHGVDSYYALKAQKTMVFEKLAKFLDMRISRLQKGEGAARAECNQPRRPTYSIIEAMTLLKDYANVIPLETYLKATNYFSVSADMRETFLNVEPVYRVAWLMGLQ